MSCWMRLTWSNSLDCPPTPLLPRSSSIQAGDYFGIGTPGRRWIRWRMRFADPVVLLLLVIPVGYALHLWRTRRRPPSAHLGLPALSFLADLPISGRVRVRRLLQPMRVVAMALIVLALARPQTPHDVHEIRLRSRNIMLAL